MHVQKVKEQEKAYNKQVRVYHSFIYLFLINHFNLSLTNVPLYMHLCPLRLTPAWGGGGGVLLGILGVGVPSSFPNPDPIADQRMSFSTSVFRPGLCCSKRG